MNADSKDSMSVKTRDGDTPAWLKLVRSQFMNDYGMIFVLLLLCGLFSLLTLKEQHPTGAAAGERVAELISANKSNANVLIVTRNTSEDRLFSEAAESKLTDIGANVLATVNGQPADVRKAIEQVLADGNSIDAIAANDVTAKWSVYARFESVGSDKCVTPHALSMARLFEAEQHSWRRKPDGDLRDHRDRDDHGDHHWRN